MRSYVLLTDYLLICNRSCAVCLMFPLFKILLLIWGGKKGGKHPLWPQLCTLALPMQPVIFTKHKPPTLISFTLFLFLSCCFEKEHF